MSRGAPWPLLARVLLWLGVATQAAATPAARAPGNRTRGSGNRTRAPAAPPVPVAAAGGSPAAPTKPAATIEPRGPIGKGGPLAAAGDVRPGSDLNPEGACKAFIKSSCSEVENGDSAVALCVREQITSAARQKREQPATPACLMEVRTFFRGAARANPHQAEDLWAVQLTPGLRQACAKDAKELCPGKMGPVLTMCMKSKKTKLSADCSAKLFKVQLEQAKDLGQSPAFMDACKDDLERLPDCRSPSLGAVRAACLKRHRTDLAEACRAALFTREVETAEDIRLNRDVFETCREEIQTLCSNKEYGESRMMQCLWEKTTFVSPSGRVSTECKEKVNKLTVRSVQDYRLDFKVRTKCASLIDKYCETEKATVDGLSMAELFGTKVGDYAAQSGQVIQCLKRHVNDMPQGMCKEEMRQVVRVQAMNSAADPILKRQCATDIKQFCTRVPPVMVHLCLRRHMNELSAGCKATEVLQGTLESTSINLKPQLLMACKSSLDEFCHGISPTDAQVLRCLQDNRMATNFPVKCKEAVEQDMEASNHDWRLKFGISHECQKDAAVLCQDDLDEGAGRVLTCLKAGYTEKEIRSNGCKEEMRRFIAQGVSDIRMAPNTYKHCVDDVERYCENVEPGSGRVHDCLVSHKSDLSQQCALAEFSIQAARADDIRVDRMSLRACGSFIQKYCGGVQMDRGKMWNCLKDHASEPDVPPQCRERFQGMQNLQHSEFTLNVGMAQNCKKDAEQFCFNELQTANQKDFTSDGQLITCLMRNMAKLTSPDCKNDVRTKTRERIKRVALDPMRKSVCDADIDSFCPEFKNRGKALAHQCLTKHYDELSFECRDVQKQYMVQASSDIRVNVPLLESCKAAQKAFCSDVKEGESRVINCLLDSMHEETMDPLCRKNLVVEQKKRTMDYEMNTRLSQACKTELSKLDSAQKCNKTKVNWKLTCVTDHIDEISSTVCKVLARSNLARQSADLRARPGMETQCTGDLQRLCPGVEAGGNRWHACLRAKRDQISDLTCKKMVDEFESVAAPRARVNFAVRKACANEMKVFCKDIPPGESRIMVCLKVSMEEPGFTKECKNSIGLVTSSDEIVAKMKNFTKTRGFKMKDLQKWVEQHENFTDKWGGLLLAGTISFVAIAAFACSYCILRAKYNKVMYTVAQPDNPDL